MAASCRRWLLVRKEALLLLLLLLLGVVVVLPWWSGVLLALGCGGGAVGSLYACEKVFLKSREEANSGKLLR